VWESGDVGGVELLEFNRGAPAQGTVASLPVVEDLQVLKDRVGELDAGAPASLVESRLFEARPSANAEGIRSARGRL
jgi:hypothetical protein